MPSGLNIIPSAPYRMLSHGGPMAEIPQIGDRKGLQPPASAMGLYDSSAARLLNAEVLKAKV